MHLPTFGVCFVVGLGLAAAHGQTTAVSQRDTRPQPGAPRPSATKPAPGPLAGMNVLVIGASQFAHEGYLISTLHTDLQKDGAAVSTYGACASIPEGWVTPQHVPCGTSYRLGAAPIVTDNTKAAMTWPVRELIDTYHPKLVVIGIADSLAGYRQPELPTDWLKHQVHELVTAIAAEHVPCIWLGTTWGTEGGPLGKNFARVKQLSAVLKENVAPCEYIDSLAFSTPGEWATIDGQHHTGSAYLLWGAAASKAIEQTDTVKALQAAR